MQFSKRPRLRHASRMGLDGLPGMRFRPCIDLHNGRVKQIVGSTLSDDVCDTPETNFESDDASEHFAALYARDRLPGGHIIMLGPGNEDAALKALRAFPGGMQIGGGINPQNAMRYLDAGASHVIVTSYVFHEGIVDWERVREMRDAVGKSNLVLDLSCRYVGNEYAVCTNRWQNTTDVALNEKSLEEFAEYADEILIHAVDVEGKKAGMDIQLLRLLATSNKVPITYAGGIRSMEDLELAREITHGAVDVTVGSALDIFGGTMKYSDAVRWQREQELVVAGTAA